MDAPKSIIYKGVEIRFVIGLVAATSNTVKLYTVYENATAFEVGSWRLH